MDYTYMNSDFFSDIVTRYGIGKEALKDAWEKTRSEDPVSHVKKFKAYLTHLTGSDVSNFNLPEMPDHVQEGIVASMLMQDMKDVMESI